MKNLNFFSLLIILAILVPLSFHIPSGINDLPKNVLTTVEGPTQTQVNPTVTPFPTLTPIPTDTPVPVDPTRTPKPTSTPIATPPPANPDTINMMILFGVISVIVVVIGVWINRQRTF